MNKRLLTILLSACFISVDVSADSLSLYRNGHPISGKSGSVLGATTLRHCLVASFRANDGEQRLDSFNISSGSAQFAHTTAFGNLLEDQNNLIPDAQLKAPRDLATVNGTVVWWSYYKVHVGTLDKECKIQAVKSFDFANSLNSVFNRIETPAQVVSQRKMLTDQQVTDLIVGGATQDQVSEQLYNSGIYDFSHPEAPFLASYGPQLGALSNGTLERFTLTVNGNTTIASLKDKSTLDISLFTPEAKTTHVNAFFTERIKQIFNGRNLGISLDDLKTQLLSSELHASLLNDAVLGYLFEIANRSGDGTLVDALKVIAPEKAKLKRILAQYRLNENSTVKSVVTALVADALKNYDATLSQSKVQLAFAQSVSGAFYNNPQLSLLSLKESLQAAMLGEFNAQGLVNYLVNVLMAPLADDLPLLKISFKELLDGISANALGAAVDGSLNLLSSTIPVNFLDQFFQVPQCLQIPSSSREFLNLALVTSGPKVNPDGVAFFELLKLVDYYFENDDFNRLTAELEARVKDLQAKIAEELTVELTRGVNFQGDLSLSTRDIFNQSFSVNLKAVSLSEPITTAILKQLEALKIKPNTKLKSAMLKAAKAKIRGRGVVVRVRAASRKLSKKEEQRLLKNLTVGKFITYITPKASQPTLRVVLNDALPEDLLDTSALSKALDEQIRALFGSISLKLSLGEAATHFIRTRINHNLIGDFVSETLGEALASMSGNGGGIPVGVRRIWRAAHGDCLALWQGAFVTASGLAAPVLPAVSADFLASEALLSTALDQGIKFVVQQTLSKFLEGVFSSAGGSYPRWQLGLKKTDYAFSVPALSGVSTKLASLFAYRDTFLLIQRNGGVSLPDFGTTPEVFATLFKLDGSKQVISLGSWSTVSVAGGAEGLVLLRGDNATNPTLLLDFRTGALRTSAITDTQIPPEFQRPDRIQAVTGNKLMLHSEFSGLYITDIPA